ncbi:APC family permease [Ochrovirga pacifica]|uniref:APC family permease n=1 Tax=Ochrovirga pacifica TaxID=1042376 RepID=UPI000255A826|nr:APC family permease [Ochrovirga pacifica]
MNHTQEDLKREVDVVGLGANIINIVVGGGIFALPAVVAAQLGTASIFAYLFCGLLVALVMFCFAEVGSKVTVSGGAYAYIHTAFGPYAGFLTSVMFVLSTISADAAVANALMAMVGSVNPWFQTAWVKVLFFALFFAGLGAINVRGIKQGMNLVKLLTIIKITSLLVLVACATGSVNTTYLAIEEIPSLGTIGKVCLVLFFAFQGAETGLSISGEVKKANKTIPKAIFLSITGILVLYIAIQTVSMGVLGSDLLLHKENPLGQLANQVFGPVGLSIMTAAAAISMFGIVTGEVLSMPRILYRAAKDQVLPIPQLASTHPLFKTPYVAIITYASLGFLFASLGGFEQLAIFSSATILLVYLGVSLSVIKLRKMVSDTKGFKAPGGLLIPILAVATIVWVLSNLTKDEFIAIVALVLGLTILYLIKKKVSKNK